LRMVKPAYPLVTPETAAAGAVPQVVLQETGAADAGDGTRVAAIMVAVTTTVLSVRMVVPSV
jgi:hypothetical protein